MDGKILQHRSVGERWTGPVYQRDVRNQTATRWTTTDRHQFARRPVTSTVSGGG